MIEKKPMDHAAVRMEESANNAIQSGVVMMFQCYDRAPLTDDWREQDRDGSALLAALFATMDRAVEIFIERHGFIRTEVLMDLAAAFYARVAEAANEAPEVTTQ